MLSKVFIAAMMGLFFVSHCLAGQKVVLLALFKDKAIVTIDGQRRLIAVGKTSPEGVRLLSADSKKATLSIDGKNQILALGAGVAMFDSAAQGQNLEVVISKDKQGMFATQAVLNDSYTVNALIDTGASAVAMNRKMAEKLHLNLSAGQAQTVDTAGGQANSQEISLDSVKVGAIEVRNVKALIVESTGMDNFILLGMSFLGQLKMINNPNHLILMQAK